MKATTSLLVLGYLIGVIFCQEDHFKIFNEMTSTSSSGIIRTLNDTTKLRCSILCVQEKYCNLCTFKEREKACKLMKTNTAYLQSAGGWISLTRNIELVYQKGMLIYTYSGVLIKNNDK